MKVYLNRNSKGIFKSLVMEDKLLQEIYAFVHESVHGIMLSTKAKKESIRVLMPKVVMEMIARTMMMSEYGGVTFTNSINGIEDCMFSGVRVLPHYKIDEVVVYDVNSSVYLEIEPKVMDLEVVTHEETAHAGY